MNASLSQLRHVVLDMDGTIYLGDSLFPETLPLLELLRRWGIGYTFFTNNNSHSRAEYASKLKRLGIRAVPESIVTSCDATVHYLREHLPDVERIFVLGTDGLKEDFQLQGFSVVEEFPQAVIVGFDRTLAYSKLCQAAYWISHGLPYIATHPDRICPTNEATVLPDCGAICSLIETATGRCPDAVPGKPDPTMLYQVMSRQGLTPSEVVLVGDRIYTDIRMARAVGISAVLTLTGESSREQAESLPADQCPTIIVDDLADFSGRIRVARSLSPRP